MNSSEKLQKVLATAGLGSRRQIEEWIKAGRVSVNGKSATIGDRISGQEKIQIDGREIRLYPHQEKKCRVLIYHKPEGEICSRSDPENRRTVFERLPLIRNGRWINIGRLDINTSGLLLFTNDGELANRLMHPSSEIEREYAVRVAGEVTPAMIAKLTQGIRLEDGKAKFESIIDAGGSGYNHWYHVMVKEGRNRLVRRLFEAQGIQVSRLIRIRYANLLLPRSLRDGRWEELGSQDIADLMSLAGISEETTSNTVYSSEAKDYKGQTVKIQQKKKSSLNVNARKK